MSPAGKPSAGVWQWGPPGLPARAGAVPGPTTGGDSELGGEVTRRQTLNAGSNHNYSIVHGLHSTSEWLLIDSTCIMESGQPSVMELGQSGNL